MNPHSNLVLIKCEDKTDNILRITRESDRVSVTFIGGKTYRYSHSNVLWLSKPIPVSVEGSSLSINGDVLSDVVEVLRFDQWAKVFHGSGKSRCCSFSSLSIRKGAGGDGRSSDMLAYYRELAEATSIRTNEGDSLLAMKYRQLDLVSHRSILAGFLGAKMPVAVPLSSETLARLMFPFGCNMSQKTAVQNAICYPVTLVQGPPGTGKTQTILNLLANLLMEGKHVAVVSNNNTATANVRDKLQKYELGFVAAFLGSKSNKLEFITGQDIAPARLQSLEQGEESSAREEISRLNRELEKGYETKNELSSVIQQIEALRLEKAHYEQFRQELNGGKKVAAYPEFKAKISSRKIMEIWMAFEPEVTEPIFLKVPSSSPSSSITDSVSSTGPQQALSFMRTLSLLLRFGPKVRFFFRLEDGERISVLQLAYYQRKLEELEALQKKLEASLQGFRFDERLERLTDLSMSLLKHRLAQRYNDRPRKLFSLEDLWKDPDSFLKEYPVILSTTFSVITSVKNGYLFDCVIVDEASQVDLLNGVLAMGCAKKIVIVGDPMQLPNVLTRQDIENAKRIG